MRPVSKDRISNRRSVRRPLSGAATLATTLAASSVAVAQTASPQSPPQTTPPPSTTEQVMPPSTATPQPSAKTPPTPLPKGIPDTAKVKAAEKDVKPANLFNEQTMGQSLPDDPKVVRSLDDALAVAFRRSPTILQAQESILKTSAQVNQIKALKLPQVSVGGSYSRLANASSTGAFAGGVTPSAIQNPFGVGLTSQPPGSTPVSLSSSGGSGGFSSASSSTTQTAVSGSTTGVISSSTSSFGGATSGGTGTTRAVPVDSASGAVTRAPAGSSEASDITRQSGGDNNSFSSSTNLNQASARVTVSQLIDITGVVRAAERFGDLQKALSRLELARLRQQTAYNVRNAYYNLLRAQAFVAVDESAVEDSRELLRVTQAQKNAGVASEFDVLRAQTQLDNNNQALISARNQVALSKNAFANTIGLDPSTPVEAQEQPVPPAPTLEEEPLIQEAFSQRPEFLQANVNLLKAQTNIRLARRNLEPYLNANVSGGYNAIPSGFNADKATGSVGLTLTVPLYDGGATKAAVDQAHSDERVAQVQRDQFIRGIKAEVQQSIIAVQDADQRVRAISQTVTEGREALRLANVRFRAGVGTQLDVNDAQTALVQAQTNQVNAQYDYLGSLARLSLAVGTPE